jgi:hypothetical protein
MLILRAYLRVHAAFDGFTRRIVRPFGIASWLLAITQLTVQIIHAIVRAPLDEPSSLYDMNIGARVRLWFNVTTVLLIIPMCLGVIAMTWWALTSLRFVVRNAASNPSLWTQVQRSAHRLIQLTRSVQVLVMLQICVQIVILILQNTVSSWYIINAISRTLLLAIPAACAYAIQPAGAQPAAALGVAIVGGAIARQVQVLSPKQGTPLPLLVPPNVGPAPQGRSLNNYLVPQIAATTPPHGQRHVDLSPRVHPLPPAPSHIAMSQPQPLPTSVQYNGFLRVMNTKDINALRTTNTSGNHDIDIDDTHDGNGNGNGNGAPMTMDAPLPAPIAPTSV